MGYLLHPFPSTLRLSRSWIVLPIRRCVPGSVRDDRLHQSKSRQYSTRREQSDRVRLSTIWVPSGGIAANDNDAHSMLVRAGYLRQAHSGIYHMLPLGRRVQEKLEMLIDKYMMKLGSSKVDLSSITSEELWEKSGRLSSVGSELFRFKDRKHSKYLLSPTHEEEITTLVSSSIKSYKDLPVRVHQISRKYRDELRPRYGLLRSREFIMKDLYTFDQNVPLALATYHEVRKMYSRLFDELKIPYLVAEADSGDMGGELSHEFHFPTAKGEDHIISCDSCDYVSNEEKAVVPSIQRSRDPEPPQGTSIKRWYGMSQDRSTLITVWYPSAVVGETIDSASEVNFRTVKAVFPELDSSRENAWYESWVSLHSRPQDSSPDYNASTQKVKIINLVDARISQGLFQENDDRRVKPRQASLRHRRIRTGEPIASSVSSIFDDPVTQKPLNLLRIRSGDACPRCHGGKVVVQEAIELGHTFHLGSRYTKPLEANVSIPDEICQDHESDFEFVPRSDSKGKGRKAMIQMGCHGIGVSRMIGAVADMLADEKGLNWPRVMAPFEAVIVPAGRGEFVDAAEEVYDSLLSTQAAAQAPLDLVLDDRKNSFGWKMKDADLVGYPVVVVVGKKWAEGKMCEVQCRRLKVNEDVAFDKLPRYINDLLDQL